MVDLKSLKVSLASSEKLSKLNPIYIRQKNYEFLFEDKKHNTVKTSLKLLEASFIRGILLSYHNTSNILHKPFTT